MAGSYAVGVDLGGTKTEAALCHVHDNGTTVQGRIRVKTPNHDYNQIVHTITNLITSVAAGLPNALKDVSKIGICTPGTEYGPDRLIANSNTQALQEKPLRRDIQNALGRSGIAIENDANCFALAEAVMGAGVSYDAVFGVIMGTGVGGGLVIDKKIHRGRTGMAGEWGHHTLHAGGNLCYCGNRGCVETYLSGPALERRWEELMHSKLAMPQITSRVISHKNNNGGNDAWLSETLENFGHALANVIDIIDPDAVIMGGGLSNMPIWYDAGAKSVRDKIFSQLASDVPIVQNRLGDSAGVIGACLL